MNIGVIGVGYWGSKVVNEYLQLAKERIIGEVEICDVNMKASVDYGKNPFVGFISTNYKEFLKKDIDGVHICTPNDTHYAIAKEALENGKHVLIEKPMTTNSNDAYKLIELSADNGLILQVGHIFRFANVIRKAKELMKENYFGKVYYFTLKWTTMMQPIKGVDIIWDLLPHPLDIIHFLTGEYPYRWQAMGGHFRRGELSEMAFINLDYGSFKANVELSWLTRHRKRELLIAGEKRVAVIECVKQKMKVHEGEQGENTTEIKIEANNTIREEALNFISSIKNGKMPFNSHIIGAKNVDIIERIMEGQWR